jgi:uncharacterized membrane protein YhhN
MTDTLLLPAAAMAVFTSAAIYGYGFLNAEISAWRSFWKTLPVAIMAIFVITTGAWLLALALVLSAIGDYFLSREDEKFTIGLVSFLTAHLLYIWLFWQLIPTASFGWGQGVMLAYALIYGTYLWPRVGEYRIPVLAYIFVITIMVSTAFMLPTGFMLVLLGSLSFAISDSVLALEMFVITNPKTKIALSKIVWVSYIAAQALLVIGLI